jgi:hypothetical protein
MLRASCHARRQLRFGIDFNRRLNKGDKEMSGGLPIYRIKTSLFSLTFGRIQLHLGDFNLNKFTKGIFRTYIMNGQEYGKSIQIGPLGLTKWKR